MRVHYQDALTATVSHEQMNPLNSIVNILDLSIQHLIQMMGMSDEEAEQLRNRPNDCLRRKNFGESYLEINVPDLVSHIKSLSLVLNSAKLIYLLNQGILSSSLMKQNQLAPSVEQVKDLSETLRDFTQLFSTYIAQNDLKLEFKDEIKADYFIRENIKSHGLRISLSLYQQILYNIFMNACKFNKPKGSIRIEVEARLRRMQRSQSTVSAS